MLTASALTIMFLIVFGIGYTIGKTEPVQAKVSNPALKQEVERLVSIYIEGNDLEGDFIGLDKDLQPIKFTHNEVVSMLVSALELIQEKVIR